METHDSVLNAFMDCHQRLITIDRIIRSQFASQKDITSEVIKFSKDEICELRLLSLVRSKLIRSPIRTPDKIVNSQTFQTLKFSSLEYCPSFINSNKLNHYMFLASTMRKRPEILAQVLYDYSILHPEKIHRLAYSLFLTLFQQGWSYEEDHLLCKTLKNLLDIQIESKNEGLNCEIKPPPPRLLKYSLIDVESACAQYQPFITFSTAYLFNGASFAYLQTALAPIITKLHSLSHLYDLRANFDTQTFQNIEILAPIQYWKEIVSYAHDVLVSLGNCLQLLPPSFFSFFAYLKEKKADLYLIFFESFINRALDNPAVLGLLPWHPSHGDWNPSKDIANVFRSKFIRSLASKTFAAQQKVLLTIDEYKEIDIESFLQKITQPSDSSYMISEAELLETNPSFPKELLITGSDCLLLHKAASKCKKPPEELTKILSRLGEIDQKTPDFNEHFRMVITRTKNFVPLSRRNKSSMSLSLFGSSNTAPPQKENERDSYAEQLCDIISELPPLPETGAKSISEYITISRHIAPFFLQPSLIIQAEAVLWYAQSIAHKDEEIVSRITSVVEGREKRGVSASDRTSSLRTQHQRILSSLSVIQQMRENLQSNFNLELADIVVSTTMSQNFKDAMVHCHEFVNNSEVFKKTVITIKTAATEILNQMKLTDKMINEVCRLLFFKLTDHITFRRYMQSDAQVWKRSVIVSKILETKRTEMLEYAERGQPDTFFIKESYFQRAADLLGHIRNNSGMSVILYYVLEMENVIQTVCSNCRDLKFEGCLLWVLIKTKAKHIYMISKFIQHFILQGGFLDRFFHRDEITMLGIFSSSVLLLLQACHQYDKRIKDDWA
ncbi:hypothetical protein TRFO_40477 [Tritrichomonas foetus]|uniref:Uncharacterized protein n=1 Tax=Tritrichomonas foetus TaxID=1144522 RepID=A0A1J4J716_9EUKA|nr:hypothetical protein TRFO_40477 [Tritrichomonas foetus]|eukprot:OHS93229.1 hypothetical protein TRFO_40477 [Tritrichomonas foetus]